MKTKRFWQHFWYIAGSVSIRGKIMGIVASLVLGFGIFMGWYIPHSEAQYLTQQVEEKGLTLAKTVAAAAQDMALTNNQSGLYILARNTLNANKDVVYIFITNSLGELLVHTFEGGFPVDLLELGRSNLSENPRVTPLLTEPGNLRDVAAPIPGSRAGVVHIGLDETGLLANSREHYWRILTITAAVLLFGILVAYWLATVLTRPISNLELATKIAADNNFSWEAPIWAQDEIGRLGTSFNEMTRKMAERTEEIVRKNKELTALWQELKHKENLRTQLLGKVISAQEEERKRIARELHDQTSQSLTSLMVGLKVAEETSDNGPMKQRISELRNLAAGTLEGVRDLSLALRPSVLDDLGLIPALNRYIKDYAPKTGLSIQFQTLGFSEQRLRPEVETAIYRVIQEALTNVVRHAEAKNVSVILEHSRNKLRAIVEDDGKGFDVDQVMFSPSPDIRLGLFGMGERVSLLEGKLTIESAPGKGTTVYVEVPLDEHQL